MTQLTLVNEIDERTTPGLQTISESRQEKWEMVKNVLNAELGDDEYNAWFSRLEIASFRGNTVVFSVVTPFLKHWIIQNYYEVLRRACFAIDDSIVDANTFRIEIEVRGVARKVHAVAVPCLPEVTPPPPLLVWSELPKEITKKKPEGTTETAIEEVIRPVTFPIAMIPLPEENRSVVTTNCMRTSLEALLLYQALLATVGVSASMVKRVVSEYLAVSEEEMVSSNRSKRIVVPRQIAMYVCWVSGKDGGRSWSLPEIGKEFGDRDHTTVLHSRNKFEDMVSATEWGRDLQNLAEVMRRVWLLRKYEQKEERHLIPVGAKSVTISHVALHVSSFFERKIGQVILPEEEGTCYLLRQIGVYVAVASTHARLVDIATVFNMDYFEAHQALMYVREAVCHDPFVTEYVNKVQSLVNQVAED